MTDCFGLSATDTTPLDTASRSTGAFNFFDASPSSVSRASAAAALIRGPPLWMEALDTVPPWLGVRFVSSRTVRIWRISRSSSLAAICNSAVEQPCPSSTNPTKTVAVLSA